MDSINTKNDLITLPIGKILIVRKNGKKEFYIVDKDNTVRELNEEERKYIDNIFDPPRGPMVYSKSAIDIARENQGFKGEFDLWLPVVEAIDKYIPDSSKEKFHRNLRTLKNEVRPLGNAGKRGGYNIPENRLVMGQEYFNYLIDRAQKGEISDIKLETNSALIHELLHGASSENDNGIYRCGLGVSSEDGKITSYNTGLNEGVTEMLTEDVTRGMYGKVAEEQQRSGYLKEKLIAKQLRYFCPDEIKEEYFNGSGTQKLKETMKKYYKDFDNPEEEVDLLFDRIEDGFNLKDYENGENFQSTIPLQTQNRLLTALESKMEQDVQNGTLKSPEDVEEYLSIYGKNLLTPENLHLQEDEQSKFPGLEMVTDRFEGIKEKYKQRVIEDKQQNATTEIPIVDYTENNSQQSNVVENNIAPRQIEQATENVTISSINSEIAIAENVIEAPVVEEPAIE